VNCYINQMTELTVSILGLNTIRCYYTKT